MTAHKRKKNSRQRGTQTHGWGSKKKHRGSGSKGGYGMAGTGKRADQKKPTIINEYGDSYYGRHGFNRPQKVIVKVKPINLYDLQSKLEKYVNQKLVTKENGFYVVDVEKLGYNKVLGGGKLDVKLKLKAMSVSDSAMRKIKESGGIVESENVPNQ